MDNKSNTARSKDEPVKTSPLPGSGAMLIIKGKLITTRYKERIHEVIMRPKHEKYFLEKYKKYNVTKHGYHSINWSSIGSAKRKLTLQDNTRLTKFLNGWLHVGHKKEHMK